MYMTSVPPPPSLPPCTSYQEFLKQTNELNKMETYSQLMSRTKRIGYTIRKVVYRGYEASRSLQVSIFEK